MHWNFKTLKRGAGGGGGGGGTLQCSDCDCDYSLQTAAGKEDQFQLFACFYEASMIERKVGDKMIQFEMSIGKWRAQCRLAKLAPVDTTETLFCRAVTSNVRQRLLHKMTNSGQFSWLVFTFVERQDLGKKLNT